VKHVCFIALFLVLVQSGKAQTHPIPSERGWLQGRVTDSDGSPLPDVTVLSDLGGPKSVFTDSAGRFTLKERAKIISFRKVGFRPTSAVIDESRESLQVILEPVGPTEWRIPKCPAAERDRTFGMIFRLPVPSSMKIQGKGCSVDACVSEIHFTEQTGATSTMWITVGSAIGGDDGWPAADGAATITERHLISGEDKGIDSRGTLHNGRFWRDVASWYGAVRYTNVSAESAAAFDRIIDAACYADPQDD
jgi:hypothetical protein